MQPIGARGGNGGVFTGLSGRPGIGFEGQNTLYAVMRDLG